MREKERRLEGSIEESEQASERERERERERPPVWCEGTQTFYCASLGLCATVANCFRAFILLASVHHPSLPCLPSSTFDCLVTLP